VPGLRQIRLAIGLVPPRASGGRRSEWTGSKASSLRLLPLANRSLMNRDALVSAQPTRLAEDRFSRFSPAHRADFEGQQRAESEPTRVVLGKERSPRHSRRSQRAHARSSSRPAPTRRVRRGHHCNEVPGRAQCHASHGFVTLLSHFVPGASLELALERPLDWRCRSSANPTYRRDPWKG
jgi:hypothetical protein